MSDPKTAIAAQIKFEIGTHALRATAASRLVTLNAMLATRQKYAAQSVA